MRTHELRTWPSSVRAIRAGEKTRELRSESEIEVGDAIVLAAWNRPDETVTVSVVAIEPCPDATPESGYRVLTYALETVST